MARRILIASGLWLGLLAGSLLAGEHVISQKGKTFAPAEITVKVGDTVVFKNDDEVTHNVFSNSKGNEFNLKSQSPGSAASQTFKAEGKAEVQCAFHPKMKMTVNVTK